MLASRLLLRRWILGAFLSGLALFVVVGGPCGPMYADDDQTAVGKKLFEHEWKLNDPLSHGGDGLGPMFNARSCAECHNQGGGGGGGANEHNVDLLTFVADKRSPEEMKQSNARKRLTRIAPGFKTANTVVVHRFGSEPEYEDYRSGILGLRASSLVRDKENGPFRESPVLVVRRGHTAQAKNLAATLDDGRVKTDADLLFANPGEPKKLKGETKKPKSESKKLEIESIQFQKTQRNTPSLFGSGQIDRINIDDLKDIIEKQPASMRGNLAGRFGWRGQTADLRHFVVGACANELGLQTPGNPQAIDPLQPDYRLSDPDMDVEQVDALVSYVASLPPPRAYHPETAQQQAVIERGSRLFVRAKCSVCHVQNVGPAKGVYSDLLLHRMGPRLADEVTSPSAKRTPFLVTARPIDEQFIPALHGYFMSDSERPQFWRTPPLWGVRDSAPYLHDGRAATLDEAIRMHGGQASVSVDKYKQFSAQDKQDLLACVQSLGVP